MLSRSVAVIAIAILSVTPVAAAGSPAHACAEAARYPTGDDPTGAAFDKLDSSVAIPLCEKALAADPNDNASRANLARALGKAGRHKEKVAEAKRAADGGSLQATRLLAVALENGEGVAQDKPSAFALMKLAAEAGYLPAMDSLGLYLSNGTGVAKDDAAAVVWMRKAAAGGERTAMNNLAVAYQDGNGVEMDPVEANRLFRLAAERGLPEAMRTLGHRALHGEGMAKDFAAAVDWYRNAAAAGDLEAYSDLGDAFSEEGSTQDFAEALNWYRVGHEAGVASATASLGWMAQEGKGGRRDFAEARRYLEQAAEAGDPFGQRLLGRLHDFALGVPEDNAKAIELYRRAAEGGDTEAMRLLGYSYQWGDGVSTDHVEALSWFHRAADADDADAMADIGQAHELGRGVKRDYVAAIDWYRRGDQAGSNKATEYLGVMYDRGRGGIIQDSAEAVRLFRKSAEAGSATGMRKLGDALYWGTGTKQDRAGALTWYRRAAETGNSDAMRLLGERYFKGDGAPIDYGEARQWLARASDAGDVAASETLVRATLVDASLQERDHQALAKLEAAAGRGEGWALAALAWPGPALDPLKSRIDTNRWRAALEAAPASAALDAANAVKAGHLAEQRLDAAFSLSKRAEGDGDPFAATQHQIQLMIELKLIGAALRRYDSFTQSELFLAAPEARRSSFETYASIALDFWWPVDERMVEVLERLAVQDFAIAAVKLGGFYSDDGNPRRNYDTALEWYRRAAELGHADAHNGLGLLYANGLGVERDYVEAARRYRLAIASGSSYAKRNLGEFYLLGHGVDQDHAEAARLLSLASQEGVLFAKHELALLRFGGLGGRADPAEAIKLLQGAVDCAYPRARVTMAQAYWEGAGVRRDPAAALRWMKLAASYPESVGQVGMARAAALGWGMVPDASLMRTYLIEARRRGDSDAEAWLETCGDDATIACLIGAEGFVPKPLMKAAIAAADAADAPDFQTEEQRLRGVLRAAVSEERAEIDVNLAFAALETHYRLWNKPEQLLRTELHRVIARDFQLSRVYGRVDNYFALFDSSCAWSGASKVASAFDRPEAAVLFAKVAVNRLQQARARITDLDDDIRECFVEAHRDRYRQLAEIFLDMGRFEEAENVLAMLKDFEHASWTSGDEGRGQSLSFMPMSAAQQAALDRIAEASAALTAAADARALKADVAARETSFETTLDAVGLALATLERAPPALVAGGDRAPRVQAVLQAMGRPDVAALQAVAGPQRIHWLLTTPTGQKVIPVPVELSTVAQAVRTYRQALLDVDPEAQNQAKALFKLVFLPVEVELRATGAKQVMLSLDDVLRYIPFAALHDGNSWLVERYAFSSFRDASDLAEASGRRDWDVAGFGVTKALAGFDALPKVVDELSGIVQSRGGLLPGTVAVDDAFDAKTLSTAVAGNSAVIHIASHFQLDSRGGGESFLLLGTGEKLPLAAFGRAGTMRFKNADFLALSACETGLTAPGAKGVEIESMAEIAQNAGAPAVLASLWKVADDSTSQLMVSFYRHRSGTAAPTKSAALRLAQLDLIAEGRKRMAAYIGEPDDAPADFAHPFFWAPFVLLGDAT